MEQRLSLVTLGVADLGRAVRFYEEGLGWKRATRDEVDRVLKQAAAAGGRLVKMAAEAFWGGYSGYFADPDGHLWEVAHNPFWTIEADGRVTIGG